MLSSSSSFTLLFGGRRAERRIGHAHHAVVEIGQRKRPGRRKRKWCRLSPSLAALMLAGLGWAGLQIQLIRSGMTMITTTSRSVTLKDESSNTPPWDSTFRSTLGAAAAAAAAATAEEAASLALQFRRQRLQDEINTTLFSEDDFVRLSTLLSSSSPLLPQLINNTADITTTTNNNNTSTHSQRPNNVVDPDLKPILRILQNAGYKFLDHAALAALPKWSGVLKLYGPPKIYGLDTCQSYRDNVPFHQRSLGPAGTFNSGTNLLSRLVATNCKMRRSPKVARFLWQAPWGKHFPAPFIHNHTHVPRRGMKMSPYNVTLAVVTTRDPLTWIQSMCIQSYAAQYVHSREDCPNLVPYPHDYDRIDDSTKYTPVRVPYGDGFVQNHRSMADMWNDFYGGFVDLDTTNGSGGSDTHNGKAPLPGRLIVRLEDLIFHAQEVMPQICECMGATYRSSSVFVAPETQNRNAGIEDLHGNVTGILRSIIKYGDATRRLKAFPPQQLQAAHDLLNGTLMDLFGYPKVVLPP